MSKDDLSVSLTESLSISDRVAANFKRLAASAEILNAASDEFSKPIEELDDALRWLNLGLVTWRRVVGGTDDDGNYWYHEVGYARLRGKWGLAIRDRSGNHNHPEGADVEEWFFGDAPRSYRIEALEKVPDLLEDLMKNADKTAKKLKEMTTKARELTVGLKQATEEMKLQEQQKKERR